MMEEDDGTVPMVPAWAEAMLQQARDFRQLREREDEAARAAPSNPDAHCFALTMDRLFSPCTRLCDQLAIRGRRPHPEVRELNLEIATEEFLRAERAFTYDDLYATLGNRDTVAWLTPHAATVRADGLAVDAWKQQDESCRFRFNADDKVIVAYARSTEHLLEIADVFFRLLAVSAVRSVHLDNWSSRVGTLINAPTLAYLMEQCQSLKVLMLDYLEMDENHIRVLGGYSRPGLKIELIDCKLTSPGAIALADVLGRNQGPTKISFCEIYNLVVASGLGGNSRLKSLKLRISSNLEVGHREVLAIADALKENKGLVDLDIIQDDFRLNGETWGAIFDSLKAHPTLEVLDLSGGGFANPFANPRIRRVAHTSRIQALLDMMKVNMSIHTIRLHYHNSQHELFRGSVIPYLDANRIRPRVRAIQKTRPIAYRAKVLKQALLAARTDANRFWLILSGNAEVAFPSTTTPAANVPTLVTAAAAAADASSTENDADVAAFVMPISVTNAADRLPIATAAATTATNIVPNIATPSARQKRKARP
jgi:hypothetical protein